MNRQYAGGLISLCVTHGIDHFFIAPGSRCTPLTMAIADRSDVKVPQHFDERGLAFACLGFGRGAGRPAAFVCTSGTALANAFPAVIEAYQEHVPMLLLTADRPPELHDICSNQTINQQRIFDRFAEFLNIDCPACDDDIRRSLAEVSDLVHPKSMVGPVQINCMFREPFGADLAEEIQTGTTNFTRPDNMPHSPSGPPDNFKVQDIKVQDFEAQDFEAQDVKVQDVKVQDVGTSKTFPLDKLQIPSGNTIVALGGCSGTDAKAASDLADWLNAPLIADVTSGVRTLAYDLALMRDDLPVPDNVFHLGGRIVSKRWLRFLEQHQPKNYWHVWPFDDKNDPARCVNRSFNMRIEDFCHAVTTKPETSNATSPELKTSSAFSAAWRDAGEAALATAAGMLQQSGAVTEPGVARAICELIPPASGLFLGNSMPIRNMDMFGFWPASKGISVAANRGASGIDGLLASAIGFARACGQATTLLIGDLSMLHDLNSMSMLPAATPPVIVVIINNHGGGIFHFLPVVSQTNHFETYFGTPHNLSFKGFAEQFGISYSRSETMESFRDHYVAAIRGKRSVVIEVETDRGDNLQLHRKIQTAIRNLSL